MKKETPLGVKLVMDKINKIKDENISKQFIRIA